MRRIVVLFLILVLTFAAGYLLLPSPSFPNPPPGSLNSQEPADTESIYRRSFYSNLSRSAVMEYYRSQFRVAVRNKISVPVLRLNHPPEEAQTLIRDQTRSSWLEELTYPWRDTLYINGFYPTKPTEQIYIDGVRYENKITVRYVPSHQITRLTVLLMVTGLVYLLYREYARI